MNLHRRNFLYGAAAALAVEPAWAQSYPAGPVRIIVPYAAGSAADFHARLIAQWFSDRLGQQFIVENRTGAGGNTGTEVALKAPPDGRTLLLATGGNAINATLYERLPYDFLRDAAPIAGLARGPFAMVVRPQHPCKTVAEFIAYAKDRPGTVTFGSGGVGSLNHLMAELFGRMAGIHMTHVPYRGDVLAMNDVLAGHIDTVIAAGPIVNAHVQAGTLRALGITSASGSIALPEVPAIGVTVPGYDYFGWAGLAAPRGTPQEVIDLLNREANVGLTGPVIAASYRDLGVTAMTGSASEFAALIAKETATWGEVLRMANIRAE